MPAPHDPLRRRQGVSVGTLHVAIGTSARSKRIVRQEGMSWEQFIHLLRTTPPHVGQLTAAQYYAFKTGTPAEKAHAAADKDCSWFSLAEYSAPERKASNVVKVSAFVGDFDSGQLRLDQIQEQVAGYQHAILTTYSHTPEHPKYRLIVPYSQPVTPEEHAVLFNGFMAMFGEQVDSSTRDACRLWYFPSCLADTTEYRGIVVNDGPVFEPYEKPADPDDVLPQREPLDASVNADLAYVPDHERPDAAKVADMLGHVSIPDAPGQRRDPWFQVLCGVHDWSEGSEEGFGLIAAWSATQPGYVSEADVRKIWDSCGRYRGRGYSIATVIKLAVEGGYTDQVDEEVPADPEPLDDSAPLDIDALLDGGMRSIRTEVTDLIGSGKKKIESTLEVLQRELIYVADQQEYYSMRHHTLLSKDAIKQLYRAALPLGKAGKKLDPCKLLENSQTKRIVSSMGYHPGQGTIYIEHGRPLANWHSPYSPEPLQPTDYEMELFQALLHHLFPKQKDLPFLQYILQFFAYSVQKPGSKISSAPLLYSTETGTGKTTMMFELPRLLFGPLNCTTVSNDEVESQFSDFLAKQQLIHLDEVFMGGMRQAAAAANKFKPIVTNSTIRVHPKGFAGYDTTNRLIVTACSNYDNAVHLGDHDRRWAIHEVKNGKLDKSFAAAFYTFMQSARGAGVLRHIFRNISITGFHPMADAPMTEAKKEMIEMSMNDDESLLREAYETQTGPFARDVFFTDDVCNWLSARTGETVTPRRIAVLLPHALPHAVKMKRMRWGQALLRPWCARNHEIWVNAEAKDIAVYMDLQLDVEEKGVA